MIKYDFQLSYFVDSSFDTIWPFLRVSTTLLSHVKLNLLGVNSIWQHPAFVIISTQTQLLLLRSGYPLRQTPRQTMRNPQFSAL